MRTSVRLALSLGLGLAALGCGEGQNGVEEVPAMEPADVSGVYRVEGKTTVIATGETREIEGTVVMRQAGDRYVTSFEMATTFRSPDGPLQAKVVGAGEGTVVGRTLEGTAHTQIITPMFVGVDTNFPFAPRMFTRRLVNTSVGTLEENGELVVTIENRAAEGTTYQPTRTEVRGMRIGDAPGPGGGAS